jgi:hypothetical protein
MNDSSILDRPKSPSVQHEIELLRLQPHYYITAVFVIRYPFVILFSLVIYIPIQFDLLFLDLMNLNTTFIRTRFVRDLDSRPDQLWSAILCYLILCMYVGVQMCSVYCRSEFDFARVTRELRFSDVKEICRLCMYSENSFL